MKNAAIPRFSFKSALLIGLAAIFGGVIIPSIAEQLGGDIKVFTVIGLAVCGSFATAFSQCMIETHVGYGKKFLRLMAFFLPTIAIICYFWLYQGVYM